jgi:hypothetical protein
MKRVVLQIHRLIAFGKHAITCRTFLVNIAIDFVAPDIKTRGIQVFTAQFIRVKLLRIFGRLVLISGTSTQ